MSFVLCVIALPAGNLFQPETIKDALDGVTSVVSPLILAP